MVNQINPVGLAPVSSPSPEAAPASTPVQVKAAAETKAASLTQAVPSPSVAAAQVNQHLGTTETNLKLQVDLASNRGFFQIVQARTGMVLLQVPSDEVLAMSQRIKEASNLKETPCALVDKQG